MQVTFGKHKGASVGTLVLKNPDYVKWILEQKPTGALERIRAEMMRLIDIFDKKPILGKCNGHGCTSPAVRFTAYVGSSDMLYQWCVSCDPYQAGAFDGKLASVTTYRHALLHVEMTVGTAKSSYQNIIRAIALRKGLPNRSGDQQVGAFFA